MSTTTAFSRKAEDYHRHRWDYAPEAIRELLARTGLGRSSSAADLGAGTGILTRRLVGLLGHVYAIEPNAEMIAFARATLDGQPGCTVLSGTAEAVPLPDHCVDLITAAHAIHWFDAEPARREMARILRPGGWLAVVRNAETDDEGLRQAVAAIMTPENGVPASGGSRARPAVPLETYFGPEGFQTIRAPFSFRQDWDRFIGSLYSVSFVPHRDDPAHLPFERAARDAFTRFHPDGWRLLRGVTEVHFGRM